MEQTLRQRADEVERIQTIKDAWKQDMEYPYSVRQVNDGLFEARFIDGRVEKRTVVEARVNPFRVSSGVSNIKNIGFLLEQLEQRDKTIAELSGIYETQYGAYNQFLQQQNALMRSMLEDVCETLWAEKDIYNESLVNGLTEKISDTIAQVKSIIDTEGE